MPSYKQIAKLNSATSLLNKNYLVVGGTSGLGEATAMALAGMKANCTLAGRNAPSALKIIARMQALHPDGVFAFKKIDLASIRDTVRFANDVKAPLHGLIITAGVMNLKGRQETPEGLSREMAIHYYSRWTLISALLPLLEKTALTSPPLSVRVCSVLAASGGGLILEDDLDLKTNFSFIRARLVASAYNDLMLPEFSSRHPSVSFTHIFPGLVKTPLANGLPWPIPDLFSLVSWLLADAKNVGEMIAYSATSDKFDKKWNLVGESGTVVGEKGYMTPEMAQKVWAHTTEMVEKAKLTL